MSAYADTKEAVFTMEIERQRAGILGFISSHPGTLLQDNSIIFSCVSTIKKKKKQTTLPSDAKWNSASVV